MSSHYKTEVCFDGTQLTVSRLEVDSIQGYRVLDSFIVSDKSCNSFMKKNSMTILLRLRSWSNILNCPPILNGQLHKLTFIARATPNSDSRQSKIKKITDKNIISTMLNQTTYSQ